MNEENDRHLDDEDSDGASHNEYDENGREEESDGKNDGTDNFALSKAEASSFQETIEEYTDKRVAREESRKTVEESCKTVAGEVWKEIGSCNANMMTLEASAVAANLDCGQILKHVTENQALISDAFNKTLFAAINAQGMFQASFYALWAAA